MGVTRMPGITGLWSEPGSVCRGPGGVYTESDGMCSAEPIGPAGMSEYDIQLQRANPNRFNILCLDMANLVGFIHSVARARATASHTKLKWVEEKDNEVLNFIYAAMPWKAAPGWAEVDLGTQVAIDRDTAKYVDQYQKSVMRKIEQGPQSIAILLQSMDETRADCIETTRQTFADASSLNAEVLGETTQAIRTLATIKLVSDVTVSIGTAAITGGAGVQAVLFLTDLGYSLATSYIKEASEGQKVDAIAIKSAQTASKELTEETMGRISDQWGKQAEKIGEEIAEFEGKVTERSVALAKKVKGGKKGTDTIRKTIKHLKEDSAYVQKGQKKATGKQKFFKGLKWVFVASDVIDAVGEFSDTWAGAE